MRVPENTLDNYRWIFLHVPLSLRSFHLSVRQTLGTVKTLLFGDAISRNFGAITTQIYLTPGVAAEAAVKSTAINKEIRTASKILLSVVSDGCKKLVIPNLRIA